MRFSKGKMVAIFAGALLFTSLFEQADANGNGWSPLFNGQNLEGWEVVNGGKWTVEDGQIVARLVQGARRSTLVTNVDVLDHALGNLHPGDREPDASAAPDDREPKLCPKATPEPMTAKDRLNSIRYQEYVSKLPYGWAIKVLGVNFDGCDPKTGNLLEAKADIDFLFDDNDEAFDWAVKKKNKLGDQMIRQADAAEAAGRIVIWHAQSAKGYRGLTTMAAKLGKGRESFGKLFFVHDPN